MPWFYKDVAPDGAGIRLGSVERGTARRDASPYRCRLWNAGEPAAFGLQPKAPGVAVGG